MKRDSLIVLGLIAITVAAFYDVGQCGFVRYDDFVYVVDNPHVTEGLTRANFNWAWTTFYAGNYLPLTWLSFMLNVSLLGPHPLAAAMAYSIHWVNLAFHIANAVLVFLLFREATGAVWRSALVAAIFAVHPLRVESVAWVVERKDVLSGFFGLLTMLAYLRYTRRLSWSWYLGTWLLFCTTLLAKQTLSTLPCVMLLMDYWPLGRWSKGWQPDHGIDRPRRSLVWLVLEKLPLLVTAAAILVVTAKAQAAGNAIADLPLKWRLSNAPVSYVRYLGKMVWFGNLAVFYYRHYWERWQIIGSILLLLAITAFCVRKWRSRPWLIVGWFWFVGVLAPMIGIIQFGPQAMADRFTYIAGIGLLLMVIWSIPTPTERNRMLAGAGGGMLVGILMIFTIKQVSYWHDSLSLFRRAVDVADCQTAELNLGSALHDKGREAEATMHLQKAVDWDDRVPDEHAALAVALAAANKDQNRAISEGKKAVDLDQNNPDWHFDLSYVYLQFKQYDDAASEAHEAIKRKHGLAEAHRLLGQALYESGHHDEGIRELNIALRINPKLASALNALKRFQSATTAP